MVEILLTGIVLISCVLPGHDEQTCFQSDTSFLQQYLCTFVPGPQISVPVEYGDIVLMVAFTYVITYNKKIIKVNWVDSPCSKESLWQIHWPWRVGRCMENVPGCRNTLPGDQEHADASSLSWSDSLQEMTATVPLYSVLNVSHSSNTGEVQRVDNYSVLRLMVLMATTVFVPPISIRPEYTFPNAPVDKKLP